MRRSIFFVDVKGVVGRYQLYIMFFRKLDQSLIHTIFIFLTVTHHLDIQVVAKSFFPPQQGFFSLFFTYIQHLAWDFSIQVTGEHDDIFFIALNNLAVYTRHVVKTIGVGEGRHFCKVVITAFVFCQKNDLISVVFLAFVCMILTHIKLGTHDRFDDGFCRFFAGF